jgi:hypothetical protein
MLVATEIRDTEPLCPFHRCCRCPVFVFADTNLLDDSVWNQIAGARRSIFFLARGI